MDEQTGELVPDAPFDLATAPLDEPHWYNDWGGDGSDLTRPARALVLAALTPTTDPYPPPLDALLRLGDPREGSAGVARFTLPITQEHIPDLVRMARDRALNTADSDSPEVWAPTHALELLTTLDARAVLADLLPLFDVDRDRSDDPLEQVFAHSGAAALPLLRGYLLDPTRWSFGRSAAADALAELAKQHPGLREPVVDALRAALRAADQNHESTNGLIIADLVDLDAEEALPEIRHAFALGQVDEMINGGWGDVLNSLGIEPDADDPLVAESQRRWDERREQAFPAEQRALLDQLFGPSAGSTGTPLPGPARSAASAARPSQAAPLATPPLARPARQEPSAAKQAKKAKNKRKMAQASRKANQRKKR